MADLVKIVISLLLLTPPVVQGLTLSNTLGDHMVLQRDARSPPAIVWGFASAGLVVKTIFNGQQLTTYADSQGVWRQALPPTPAGGPYNITFSGSDGSSASLSDVLFGGVL